MRDLRTPIKGFVYELRRAIASPPLLVVLLIISGASLAFIPSISQQAAPPYQIEESSAVSYYDGSYHFSIAIFDNYGRGIAHAGVWANVTTNLTCPVCGPKGVANLTASTDTNGFVDLAWAHSNLTFYSVSVSEEGKVFGTAVLYLVAGSQTHFPGGRVLPLLGFTAVVRPLSPFASQDSLQVFFVGWNGTGAKGDRVYYLVPTNATDLAVGLSSGLPYLPSSWMVALGNLTSNRTASPLTLAPVANASETPGFPGSKLLVELFSPSGTFLAISWGPLVPSQFYAVNFHALAPTLAVQFVTSLLGLFVPIMAVLAAYSSYGKDRVSGVLEAVLASPVSRMGLLLSRYLAIISVMLLAGLTSIGILDGVIRWELGFYLPLSVTGPLLWGLMVEAMAFVGIVFVISHVVRSNLALIGFGLLSFAVFVYFWSLLAVMVAGLEGVPLGSPGFLRIEVGLGFLSPGQYLDVLQPYVTGGASFQTGPIDVGSMGLTATNLFVAGVFWAIAPVLIFVHLARVWD